MKNLCLVVIPLVISSLVLVYAMTARIRDVLISQSAGYASLYRMNFDSIFSTASQLRIYIDSTADAELSLMQVLREDHPSQSALAGLRNISDFITANRSSNTFMKSLYIGKPGSRYVIVDGDRLLLETFPDRAFLDDVRKSDKAWVKVRKIEQPGLDGITVVSIYQRTRYNDIVVCNIQGSYFTSVLNSSGANAFLVDRSGELVIGTPDQGEDISAFLSEMIASNRTYGLNGKTLYVIGALDTLELFYVDAIPSRTVLDALNTPIMIAYIIILIGVVFAVIISFLVSQNEYRKIGRIIKVFDEEAGADEERIFRYTHGDVYVSIVENMVSVFLDRARLETDLDKRRYELAVSNLSALQYQINPHFMFNTLQAIDSAILEETGKVGKANRMIGLFSRMLRYSLEDTSTFVPLEKEIEMSRLYLELASYRTDSGTMAIWNYDEDEIRGVETIRFILQPLIENALTHGRRNDGRHLVIKISITRREGHLLFSIFDSGCGIASDDLERIRSMLESDNVEFTEGHVGLRNVSARLVLQYGESARLKIYSHEGKGTDIFFRLPL